jgi:hypothetical protein
MKTTLRERLNSPSDSGSIDAIERIKEAIRALPVKPGADKAAAMETVRNGIQVALILGPMNESPRAQGAGHRQTLSELKAIHRLLLKLVQQIQKTHSPALRAIASQHPKRQNPLSLERALIDLGRATMSAKNLPLADLPQKNGGRNQKNGALQIARATKSLYEFYTGKRATLSSAFSTALARHRPSGSFFEFLKEVFEIGNIKADPYTFAKKVTRSSQKVSRGT